MAIDTPCSSLPRPFVPLVVSLLVLATAALTLSPAAAVAQDTGPTTGTVGGRIFDRSSGAPVSGALIQIPEFTVVLSDDQGRFVIEGVPQGEVQVTFEHLAYGVHTRVVTVAADRTSVLSVGIDPQALELDAIIVETLSELEERRLTTGFSINEIGPERIDLAARSGQDLAELLESALPGVDTRSGMGNGVCVTYRAIRSGNSGGECDGVEVRLDGVPIADPAYIYRSMPLRDIERVEILSPAQAGARYGMRTGQGVLLIETKSGRDRYRADLSRYVTGWNWEAEQEPYPWFRVLGTSLLTTAATVTLSLSMADDCFETPEDKPLALRTACGPMGTAGASIGSIILPSVAGGLAVRWAGTTERSRGRFVPSMVLTSITAVGGYLLMLRGEGATQTAGAVVLYLGIPLSQTFADRVLRILR